MQDAYTVWKAKRMSPALVERVSAISEAITATEISALEDGHAMSVDLLSFTYGWIAREIHETSIWADDVLEDLQLKLFPEEVTVD